ncbi:hypothetical protein [Methylomonas albis]|uniref:Uncharacterized protein n=1 Tax=Methylomonas albis TaxID=1854563 RepID=A0ABR9D1G8_9GAMM|nr:hypothetical protein [Methylomonas albis]MBD9356785.1 hypothetical protein [Methylomonas albis]
MSANTATPSLDSVFESAQRAHAVVELLIDACSAPAYGEAIVYSLWAVERELREIKGAFDSILYVEPEGHQPTYTANPAEACPEAAILAKLIKFAEITAEQAAGIDAELKKYRAAAAVNDSATVGASQPGKGGAK